MGEWSSVGKHKDLCYFPEPYYRGGGGRGTEPWGSSASQPSPIAEFQVSSNPVSTKRKRKTVDGF